MRSLLVVPALDADIPALCQAGAEAVVLDMAGPAEPAVVEAVRGGLAAIAGDDARPLVFVRIDGMDTPGLDAMLLALMPFEPDGFVLGRCAGGGDVQHLGAKLAVHEAELDLPDGQTLVLAELGAVPRMLLALDSFVDCSPRLVALVWHAGEFAAAAAVDGSDASAGPAQTARHLIVIAARAAGVSAIDRAVGLDAATAGAQGERARRDGFNAVLTDCVAALPTIAAALGAG